MKIAVTAKGRDLSSEVDPRFGRATYILIVDTDTLDFAVLDNSENMNAFKGAGISAASNISDQGAEVLLTGYCGPKAFATLEASNIKVVNDVIGNVSDAIKAFVKGKFSFADSANKDGHW